MKKFLNILSIFLFFFISCVPLNAQNKAFTAEAQIKITSTIVANNTTAVVIKSTGGTVYSVDAFNNSTTLAYIKLYNASSATCGTGTPQARYLIPFGASSSGGGFNVSNINGDAYGQGIVLCVTTGIADSDTGTPNGSTYIVNIHYK